MRTRRAATAAHWAGRAGFLLALLALPMLLASPAPSGPERVLGGDILYTAPPQAPLVRMATVGADLVVVTGMPGAQQIEAPALHTAAGLSGRATIDTSTRLVQAGRALVWADGAFHLDSGRLDGRLWATWQGPEAGWDGRVVAVQGGEAWAIDAATGERTRVALGGESGRPAVAGQLTGIEGAGPAGLVVRGRNGTFQWSDAGAVPLAPGVRHPLCDGWIAARTADSRWTVAFERVGPGAGDAWAVDLGRVGFASLDADGGRWVVSGESATVPDPASTAFLLAGDCGGVAERIDLPGIARSDWPRDVQILDGQVAYALGGTVRTLQGAEPPAWPPYAAALGAAGVGVAVWRRPRG